MRANIAPMHASTITSTTQDVAVCVGIGGCKHRGVGVSRLLFARDCHAAQFSNTLACTIDVRTGSQALDWRVEGASDEDLPMRAKTHH